MEFNPMHSFHSPDPIHNLEIRVLLRRVGVTDRAGASRAAKRAKEGDASKSKKSKSEKTKKTKTKKKRKKKKQQQQQRDGSDDDAEGDAEAEADSDDGESGDDESSDDESSSGSAFPDDDEPKKKKSRGAGLVPPGQVYMRTFKWQEKAFSPWELMRYHSMCRADNLAETGRILPESATGNNEEYREEMDEWLKEGLDPLSLLQPAMLFSYVDNDGFIPESERDEVATFSAPPLLIAEQVTPMEHYRAKMRRGFADEQTNRALHADRGMLSQTMYIMAAIEVDPDGFKRTAEDDAVQQPLCMIRAFPSSTRVDMQPRFSPSPIVIPNAALAVAAATKAAAGGGGAADGDAAAAAQESARMEWYRFSTARGVYEYRIENVSGPTEGAYPRFVRPAQAALLPAGEGGEADEAAKEEAAEAAEAVAKAAGEERATGLVDLLHYNEAQVRSDVEREKQLRTLSSLLDEEDERRDREATASMIARTAASFKGPVHSNEVHVHCLVELMEGSGFPGNCERLYVMAETVLPPIGWSWPRISVAQKGSQEIPSVLVDRMKHGCTHVAEVDMKGIAHFGHPIDLELWWRPREDARVPQITFHVYAVDSLQRHRVVGYGFFNLPTTPMCSEVTVRTWNPSGQSIKERVHEATVGGVKTLNDSGFVGMPRRAGDSELIASVSRFGFASTASGKLRLRVNAMQHYSPTFGSDGVGGAASMLAKAFGGGGGGKSVGKLKGLIQASSRKAKVQRRDVKDIAADYGM